MRVEFTVQVSRSRPPVLPALGWINRSSSFAAYLFLGWLLGESAVEGAAAQPIVLATGAGES